MSEHGGRSNETAQYETNWDRPCPTCKAQPGQPCRRPNGDKMTGYYGEPRFHASRKAKRVSPPERRTS